MTNKEVLDLILATKSREDDPSYENMDVFVEFLDSILDGMPLPSIDRPAIYPHEYQPWLTKMEQFLDEFMAVDPHLSYWFAWMPYRSLLKRERGGPSKWCVFVDAHDAKVEREFPEERWPKLKIAWSKNENRISE